MAALFVALGGTTYAATGGNFILGKSNSASTATQLASGAGSALRVTDTAGGHGVWASGGNHAKNTAAVHGQSGAGNAIEGYSNGNPASGVYGQDNNTNSYGVAGHSDNGVAVVGDSSNGWAVQALGNTEQTRTGNGFVKVMALVVPSASGGDKISQCFNSQLPPSQATSGNCGISFSAFQKGGYRLDFGFRVDDRFLLATVQGAGDLFGGYAYVIPRLDSSDAISVTDRAVDGSYSDNPFYIFVF